MICQELSFQMQSKFMGKGQKLYSKAKQIVAGGNMLLSKRPEMFLPEQWPSYFSKSKGCEVWDLDGKKYIDTLMMPGTNSLGYNYEEIDEAVKETINSGNMSTLNAPEEVEIDLDGEPNFKDNNNWEDE